MKDKEKQIEELTRSVADYTAKCNALCNTRSCYNCDLYGWEMDCHNVYIAKGLYEQGYRKLPEDSVVLSQEEYENILEPFRKEIITLSQENTKICDEMNSKIVNERKETVEKIIDLIKTFCPDKKFIEIISHIIAERFGVKIKE